MLGCVCSACRLAASAVRVGFLEAGERAAVELRALPRPPPWQAATIPGDRALLEQAREAASQLLAAQPDPRQWSPELRALVADDSVLQLDTHEMPTLD